MAKFAAGWTSGHHGGGSSHYQRQETSQMNGGADELDENGEIVRRNGPSAKALGKRRLIEAYEADGMPLTRPVSLGIASRIDC
jgi:hypothetical protein